MTGPVDGRLVAADSGSLDALKARARADPRGAASEAARKFEAIFLQQVLKQMRAAFPESDSLASNATRLQTEMLDQHLADKLSRRGTGLAEAITRHIARSLAAAQGSAQGVGAATNAPAAAAATSAVAAPGLPQSKQSFIDGMLEHAQAAAKLLKVPSAFVIGQAALESAWGAREVPGIGAARSHNLFGIKAGPGWTGPTVEAVTTEVIGGVPRRVVAKFRAYESYAEGFADYARLLAGSSRYAASVGADSAQAFARGLQQGGYATDPDYAAKLSQVIAAVRSASSRPESGR